MTKLEGGKEKETFKFIKFRFTFPESCLFAGLRRVVFVYLKIIVSHFSLGGGKVFSLLSRFEDCKRIPRRQCRHKQISHFPVSFYCAFAFDSESVMETIHYRLRYLSLLWYCIHITLYFSYIMTVFFLPRCLVGPIKLLIGTITLCQQIKCQKSSGRLHNSLLIN